MTGWHFHRMRKVPSAVALVLTALMAFAACGTSSTQAGNKTPIKIGVSISTSGDFSDDGKALQQGYELWADQVNKSGGLLGRQVQLDIVNDNSTPDQVTTNYQKLITVDKVDLVVGPYSSLLTKPASVVTARYGYAMLEGAGGAPSVFNRGIKGLYDVSAPIENLLVAFSQMLQSLPADQQPKSIAYVTSDDPFTEPQVDKAKAALEAAGFSTAYYQVYPAETTDYSPMATAMINKHADVVIAGTQTADAPTLKRLPSSITTPKRSSLPAGQIPGRRSRRALARQIPRASCSRIAGGQASITRPTSSSFRLTRPSMAGQPTQLQPILPRRTRLVRCCSKRWRNASAPTMPS